MIFACFNGNNTAERGDCIGKFETGDVVVTPGVRLQLSETEQIIILNAHTNGIWGEICEEDRKANQHANVHGGRILSTFTTATGVQVSVMTEADQATTTLYLPKEY